MGCVYILTNKSFRYGLFRRKLIKIGKTNRDPHERARQLSGTGVPTPFEVAFSVSSDQHDELEREIHRKLNAYRHNKDREFFKYPVKKAKQLLEELNKKDLSRVEQQPVPFEKGGAKTVTEDTRFRGNFTRIPHLGPRENYEVKLGVDGNPYYSQENGFSEAVKSKGIPTAVRAHVTIIIDNEELEIRTSQQQFEDQIDEWHDTIGDLEAERKIAEEAVTENEKKIVNNNHILEGLKTIDELEDEVTEKTEEYNQQEIKVAELETDLEQFPTEEDTSKRRQLKLYPIFGVFCVFLSLALYLFYVSALDKAFFSTLDISSMEVASYTRLNEIFDPTVVIKTFRRLNFWLFVAPCLPLGFALLIHPCVGSVTKGIESGKKFQASIWGLVIIAILAATFFLDSLLALQISKKIHDSEIILGIVETEVWSVTPTDPFTWNMNIYIVLFFGFVLSCLLGLFFHFTLEMWKEARMQDRADRNFIEKELSRAKALMKALDEEITRLSENLDNAKKKMEDMEDIPADPVLIKAQIKTLGLEIRNLEESVKLHQKRIGTIQSDIAQARKSINELESRKNKRFVDIGKLRAQIDEFLTGWNNFLAAQDADAAHSMEEVQRIAYQEFDQHFQSGGV